MKTIEICAGGGGQALGLHNAGAEHLALVEIDEHACKTLRENNNKLNLGWGEVFEGDLAKFIQTKANSFAGQVDLIAGGVPCPPFSKAGKRLGDKDERDLFPEALDLIKATKPLAVLIENVPGLMDDEFKNYRRRLKGKLKRAGYKSEWRILQANEFGVPQLRPRAILIAFVEEYFGLFEWPTAFEESPPTVGEALYDLMAANGWKKVDNWRDLANEIAPTIVGGSKKHGGPDLGPTRAKNKWQSLSVNGHRIADPDEVPSGSFKGVQFKRNGGLRKGYEMMPLLTVEMVARLQGFPDNWSFIGKKTHAYRQVGNAFPPPVAEAVGRQIMKVISKIKHDYQIRHAEAAE